MMHPPPLSDRPPRPHPAAADILERLRAVLGREAGESGHRAEKGGGGGGGGGGRWRIAGDRPDMDVSVRFEPAAAGADEPSVIWVTRPGERAPERCPIVSMQHLESFLALLSIARRSVRPVHGHVCPGE